MSEVLTRAVERYMDAVEDRLKSMRVEIRNELLLELRAAPVTTPEVREGVAGPRGERGVGVESSRILNGELVLRMSDGTEQNAGKVVGERGESVRVTLSATSPTDQRVGDIWIVP